MSLIHRKRRCAYCSRPALMLCDLTVRHIHPEFERREPCHMPICEEHRVKDGNLDLCLNHHKMLHPEAESEQGAMAS